MKCQILFSGKNKKNISKCRLLKILPRVLSVKTDFKLHPDYCAISIIAIFILFHLFIFFYYFDSLERKAKFLHADNEDSEQTVWMRRRI